MKQHQKLFFLFLMVFAIIFSGTPAQAKPYAVNYKLSGVINVVKNTVFLNTVDSRIYQLLMDAKDARKFDDKSVLIEGKAGKADDVNVIKVKKVTEIPLSDLDLPLPEYEAYQKAPSLAQEKDGRLKVSNIRWKIEQDPTSKERKASHSWETATIDPDKVLNAFFVLKPFAPKFIAAHSLYVFTFAEGGMVAEDGQESQSLALSIEAHKKIGQSYGLIKTMKKSFNIVWLLTTWDNYANLNVNFNKSSDTELFIYPMKLSREQTKALLIETVKQACVNRSGEFYHTIRNNCTNNLVVLLNRVVDKDQQIKLWRIPGVIYNLKTTMPLRLAKLLKKKGFISEPMKKVTRQDFYTDIEAQRAGK